MKRPKGGRPRRTIQKRDPRRVIRVLTEGKVTEPSYLAEWERRNRHVRLDTKEYGMAPLNLVQQAREYQKTNVRLQRRGQEVDFDEIWCVFDVDQHANLTQAINEARQSGISVAISNPCFELWLILHYEDQTAHIHRHDAQNRAQALGAIKGKHLESSNIETLLSGYDDARLRAQTIQKHHSANGSDPNANPSNNVWELIDRFR